MVFSVLYCNTFLQDHEQYAKTTKPQIAQTIQSILYLFQNMNKVPTK